MTIAGLALLILATWRISLMLYTEHGPWDVFDRMRTRAGVYDVDKGFWGAQLSCFWCCSLWASVLVLLLYVAWWPITVPLALSGGVTLLAKAGRIIWSEQVG